MQHKKTNKKKTKHIIINSLILVVLFTIIINQTVWLSNMYYLHQRELYAYSNQMMQEATLTEITERTETIGGYSVYSNNITNPNDSSRFITKKIATEDSTYLFSIDKQDPNVMPKIIQFVLKDKLPINLKKLNKIFSAKINQSYEIENTYINYIDLIADTVIDSNKSINTKNLRYIKTDTIPLDIINSIGVIGYVKIKNNALLNKMRNQLILSIALIIIAIICLIFISRSFILQWKTEKMRQDSVNVLTHEFKRPISGAVAMASAINYYLEKNEINKVLDYTQKIENELNKLTYYTKRIQQISNNEKENVQLNKTYIDIKPFFESLRQRYSSTLNEEPNVTVNLRFNTLKTAFQADLLHFSNVMDNLIENAIKYNSNSSVKIDIEVSDTSAGLKISVRDNGIGISSMDQKLIFDKFYRVKRNETKNKVGFGLGLTYVKSILEAHGGDIIVNSKLNEGSEFIITLKE
jgi:signal transduction histidine kinase